MLFERESLELKKSSWPRCDALAESLARQGLGAIDALINAATSRTHHVRSACLRAVAAIDENKGRLLAAELLRDRAYEVRETAAKILGVPIP